MTPAAEHSTADSPASSEYCRDARVPKREAQARPYHGTSTGPGLAATGSVSQAVQDTSLHLLPPALDW